jgi:2-(1,2-epoxy-1,2-dihydrophenyl)acetyl-CoA isomerase
VRGARLELHVAGPVARILFTSPENRNAIDLQFTRELAEAAARCAGDPALRVVVMQGQGEFFSVGGDIRDFVAHRAALRRHVLDMTEGFHGAIAALVEGDAVFLAAVNGMAAGGGFSLVCAADMAIARRSARFVSAYSRSGLTPDGGLSYFLPRIVGLRQAFDIMATNPTLSAEEALRLGIIARIAEDDAFEAEIDKLAQALAQSPPGVLAGLKRLLRASPSATLAQQLDTEAQSIARLAASPSSLERLAAFLAKSGRGA